MFFYIFYTEHGEATWSGTAETSTCQKLWFHYTKINWYAPISTTKIWLFISPLPHNDVKKTIILHDFKQKTGVMTQPYNIPPSQ